MANANGIELDRKLAGDIWTSNAAYTVAVDLCDVYYGRLAGTEAADGARDYLAERLRAYGLENVHAEPFSFPGYRQGPTTITLSSGRTLTGLTMLYSPCAELEAELICVGEGRAEDFAAIGDAARGKIVLARQQVHGRAAEAGAAAFLFSGRRHHGHLPFLGKIADRTRPDWAAPIAGASLSQEDGDFLERMLARGAVHLRLSIRGTFRPDTGWNVVGDLPGQDDGERVIVAGSHYDGFEFSPSATDNAAGTAVLLEAARVLAPHRRHLGRTVRFVCFSGEELGLLGSTAYVEDHAHELDQIDFMLNLDCTGSLGRKALRLHAWPELRSHMRALLQTIHQIELGDWFSYRSDHFPFWANGIPTAYGYGGENPLAQYQHTAADTADKIQPQGLLIDALLTAQLLLRLSQDQAWPGQRQPPTAVRREFDRIGITEAAINSGFLPPDLLPSAGSAD